MAIPAELARYGRPVVIREKRAFYYQDDVCESAFYLVGGRVRPVKFAPDGKPFDLPILTSGHWFGLAELFSGSLCLFDAVAEVECSAISFSKTNLERAVKNADLARCIIDVLSAEAGRLTDILANDDAQGKVISFLLSKKISNKSGIERACIRVTQSAVAESLGLTRETVNRHLKDLETLGLVSTGRGEIGIPDWESLASFALKRRV